VFTNTHTQYICTHMCARARAHVCTYVLCVCICEHSLLVRWKPPIGLTSRIPVGGWGRQRKREEGQENTGKYHANPKKRGWGSLGLMYIAQIFARLAKYV